MKFLQHLSLFLLFACRLHAQDYNALIERACDSLAKKTILAAKRRIAVTDFVNLDGSISRLGIFMGEEISAGLANRTNNQQNFKVLERARLSQILKEKELVQYYNNSTVLASNLGRIDVADVLVFSTITSLQGNYRMVIKLLDTKDGDALGAYKFNLNKTKTWDDLYAEIVSPAPIVSRMDSDGDGIYDDKDQCPYEFAKTLNGCPPVKEITQVAMCDVCFGQKYLSKRISCSKCKGSREVGRDPNCTRCGGKGKEPGPWGMQTCLSCKGTVVCSQCSGQGETTQQAICSKCRGTGEIQIKIGK